MLTTLRHAVSVHRIESRLSRNEYGVFEYRVAARLSGTALVSINGVTLRRARLILGWVTVYG